MTPLEPPPPTPGRVRRSFGFLVRYGIAGGASALTHLGTTWLLVEFAGARPVLATNVGFALSIAVSYVLQRSWVFRSQRPHGQALPRFLTVVAISALTNVAIVALGTELLDVNYLVVQIVALVAIPIINIVLNTTWTFKGGEPNGSVEGHRWHVPTSPSASPSRGAIVIPDRLVAVLRSPAARIVGLVVGLLGLAFLVTSFLRMSPSEVAVLRAQSIWSLAVGFLAYMLFNLLTVVLLRVLSGAPSGAIWASAQLVKYLPVPGSAMFGMVSRAVQEGHTGRRALELMTRHTGLIVAGGIVVGSVSIGGFVESNVGGPAGAMAGVLAIAGLAIGAVAAGPGAGRVGRAWLPAVAVGSWILLGVLVWVSVGSVTDDPVLVVSALAAAWVAGLLVLPVPAGLGVREGVLVLLLSSEMGQENAIALALITRVLHVASDGVLATALIMLERRRSSPLTGEPEVDPADRTGN